MVRWSERPPLDSPVLVAAFEGWNDAGDAASDAVRFLIRAMDARDVGVVEPGAHVDYQAVRPHVELVEGVTRKITWPTARVLVSERHDVVLVLGAEPSFRWPEYSRQITDAATGYNARMAVTLGALLGDTPHSRPTLVTGTATDDELMATLGLQRSRYEGPTGIVGALHSECREAGLASASLWAPVPHYASAPPSPKATHALLKRLSDLCELDVDLRHLDVAAEAWIRHVDGLVRQDDDLTEYVKNLEETYDAVVAGRDTEESMPSAESLAADFERYLRERDEPD